MAIRKKSKIASAALAVGLCAAGFGIGAENVVTQTASYDLKLRLRIPRVYDNMTSLGKRQYQLQRIEGVMTLGYNVYGDLVDIQFSQFLNKTQKLSSGNALTYDIFLEKDVVWPCFVAIGSNKTGKFGTASVAFYIAAEPNYALGDEPTEDNSLYLMLSGKGVFESLKKGGALKSVSGQAAGKMGCGCAEYGHKSPTRMIGVNGPIYSQVSDIAAVYGTWTMRKRSK